MAEIKDCGQTVVTLCGKVRSMIMEKQYQWMKEKRFKKPIPELVEIELEKIAEEYFKNKNGL